MIAERFVTPGPQRPGFCVTGGGMARLPRLPDRVAVMRPKLAAPKDEAGRTRYRRQVTPWREWYSTARWRKLRWSVLLRDLFTCQMCGHGEADTSQLVGDHKVPHRGDPDLFWNEANVWCLCKSCHDGAKQREERSGAAWRVAVGGGAKG